MRCVERAAVVPAIGRWQAANSAQERLSRPSGASGEERSRRSLETFGQIRSERSGANARERIRQLDVVEGDCVGRNDRVGATRGTRAALVSRSGGERCLVVIGLDSVGVAMHARSRMVAMRMVRDADRRRRMLHLVRVRAFAMARSARAHRRRGKALQRQRHREQPNQHQSNSKPHRSSLYGRCSPQEASGPRRRPTADRGEGHPQAAAIRGERWTEAGHRPCHSTSSSLRNLR